MARRRIWVERKKTSPTPEHSGPRTSALTPKNPDLERSRDRAHDRGGPEDDLEL